MFPMINNDSNSWGLCNISKAKLTYVGLFVEMIYLLFVVITGFPPKKVGILNIYCDVFVGSIFSTICRKKELA